MFALEMYEWIFISIMVIQETKNFPFAFFFLSVCDKNGCMWTRVCLCAWMFNSVKFFISTNAFQRNFLLWLWTLSMRQFYVFSSLLFRNEEIVFCCTRTSALLTLRLVLFVGVIAVVACHVLCNVLSRVACDNIQSYVHSLTQTHARTQKKNNLINYLLSL